MSKYAQIGIDKKVVNIIICEDSVINTLSGDYIKITDQTRDAAISSSYDESLSKFIDPKPYPSWILNSEKLWEPPVSKPAEGISIWNEESLVWVDVTPVEIEILTPEA